MSLVLQVQKGEAFVSETDTEVIPKLCKWIYHSLPERVPFSEVGPIALVVQSQGTAGGCALGWLPLCSWNESPQPRAPKAPSARTRRCRILRARSW